MAYLKSWGEVAQMLDDIGAKKFNIARRRDADAQSNDNAFMYDSDKSLEENKQVAERILQRCAGEIMYMTVWRTDAARTGGCKYAILYDSAPVQLPQQQVAGGAGLYGVAGGGVDIDKLTADIEARLQTKFERERLDRELKELRDEKREFERVKNGAIGLIVQKFSPVVDALASRVAPLPRVAGVDAEHPVHAQVIKPISEHQEPEAGERAERVEPESGDDLSHDVRITEQPEVSEQEVFTDEESDELFALMARFKAVEPQYMDLLRAVVEMAENGDSTYTMAKGFLLK